MERPAVVAASGLAKRLGRRPVLQGVELHVGPGERVAILGPNGAGKSTLLRILAGLARPTEGLVRVLGADPQRDAVIRKRIGTVTHESALYPDLTVHEHVAWWLEVQGHEGAPGREDARALLAEHGLAKLADQHAAALSRGQRQRLAIALAFAPRPALLVLDEPFNALDDQARTGLEALLAATRDDQAVVFTSHDEPHARRLATRVLRIAGGRLEAAP